MGIYWMKLISPPQKEQGTILTHTSTNYNQQPLISSMNIITSPVPKNPITWNSELGRSSRTYLREMHCNLKIQLIHLESAGWSHSDIKLELMTTQTGEVSNMDAVDRSFCLRRTATVMTVCLFTSCMPDLNGDLSRIYIEKCNTMCTCGLAV